MNAFDIATSEWFASLVADVRAELTRLVEPAQDPRHGLERERQTLEDSCQGWAQSLSKRDLSPMVRTTIEAELEKAISRQREIDRLLAETYQRALQVDELLDPLAVADRLNRLDEVLSGDNATLGNVELSLHIDRIDCFEDGRVELRTCKLGLLGEGAQLVKDKREVTDSPPSSEAPRHATPRRRARLRTEGAPVSGHELKAAAYLAADPNRFAALDEQWFWTDVFQHPCRPLSWSETHAEEVFLRRKDAGASYAQLALEFGVTSPTIGAAICHYVETHPGEQDQVVLQRGGKRRPKFDLSKFGDEARHLWIEGRSLEKLAEKYDCSAPTVKKAIEFAYAREGLKMPTREELRREKTKEARDLLDQGRNLEEIAAKMNVSDVTVRQYLRESFAAEDKPMPDLRRRKGV